MIPARLIRILDELRDLGNTILVVEHDPDVMRAADHIIDLGPGAGENGGRIIFEGYYPDLIRGSRRPSLTGRNIFAANCEVACEQQHRRKVNPRRSSSSALAPTI